MFDLSRPGFFGVQGDFAFWSRAQEGAGWPRRSLVVRTPNIGGAENAA